MIHSKMLAIKYSREAEQLWNEGMSVEKAIRTVKVKYVQALNKLKKGRNHK